MKIFVLRVLYGFERASPVSILRRRPVTQPVSDWFFDIGLRGGQRERRHCRRARVGTSDRQGIAAFWPIRNP